MKHTSQGFQRLCRHSLMFCITLLVTTGILVGLVPTFLTAASAAEPSSVASTTAQKSQTIKFRWHHYDKKTGYYNPADEGKEVSFPYFIGFEGKGPDGKKAYAFAQKQHTGKIGAATDLVVSTDKIVAQDKKTYTDCTINTVILPIYKGNKIYGISQIKNTKTQELTVFFVQNMQTQTTASIKKDAIILKEDEGKILIRYTLEKIKRGKSEYPHKNTQNQNVIESTLPFVPGDVNLWSGKSTAASFRRALEQNNMEMFSPYSGRYIVYKLHAEFAGSNKDELAKRYTLSVSGNDLDGWKVELGSNITSTNQKLATSLKPQTSPEQKPVTTTATATTAVEKSVTKEAQKKTISSKKASSKKSALPKTGDPTAVVSSAMFSAAALATTLFATARVLKKQ